MYYGSVTDKHQRSRGAPTTRATDRPPSSSPPLRYSPARGFPPQKRRAGIRRPVTYGVAVAANPLPCPTAGRRPLFVSLAGRPYRPPTERRRRNWATACERYAVGRSVCRSVGQAGGASGREEPMSRARARACHHPTAESKSVRRRRRRRRRHVL